MNCEKSLKMQISWKVFNFVTVNILSLSVLTTDSYVFSYKIVLNQNLALFVLLCATSWQEYNSRKKLTKQTWKTPPLKATSFCGRRNYFVISYSSPAIFHVSSCFLFCDFCFIFEKIPEKCRILIQIHWHEIPCIFPLLSSMIIVWH